MSGNFQTNYFFKRLYQNKIQLHILYWVTYTCFFAVVWGSADMDFKKTFTIELIGLPIKIMVVYFTIYLLMPDLLFRQKLVWFFITLLALVMIAVILQRYIDNNLILSAYLPDFQKFPIFNPIVMLSTAFKFVTVLAIPVTVRFLNYANEINGQQHQLQNQKLEAELTSLKNQIQPHFLFNTLNSLYSMILKKSDKALHIVLRLSELLRYVLYESEHQKNELSKEIEFIKSYIELEQIRLGNSAKIDLTINGEAGNQYIAPLLIMPFIENSVKHCRVTAENTSVISINLKLQDNLFCLTAKNPARESLLPSIKESGIGLKNVRKRLELLYPGKHKLETQQMNDCYLVNLFIEL
jgi:sensor histidine kinase YesM